MFLLHKYILHIFFLHCILTEYLDVYDDLEIKIIENFGISLGVKNYAFLQNNLNIDIAEDVKEFSQQFLYSAVFSVKELENILDDYTAVKVFERKTLIVTKGNFNFSNLIQKVSGPTLLYWFVFTELLDNLNENYIPMNSDLFAAQTTSSEIIINKLYHVKPGMNLSMTIIGIWPKYEDYLGTPILFPENIDYINFENITLKQLIFWNKDFCSSPGGKRSLDRMECFQHEVLDITAQKLNFTLQKYVCPERIYPYNYPNGTLSELFLILGRKEADLSSASYVVDVNRLNQYDFAWPTFTTKSMMYLKFRVRETHWRAFIRPLSFYIWISIISWVFLIGILMQIFDTLRSRKCISYMEFAFETIKSILDALQMFCNQGIHNAPKWNSYRLLYFLTFVLCMIVYQGYSGHLISSLTVFIPHVPFTNLEGFFNNKQYKLMTLKTGFHQYYLKKITDQKGLTNIFLDTNDLPVRVYQGVSKLCSEDKLAYVEFRENIVQYELPCKVIEIAKPILYQSVGIGFPKNSPYQEFIKRELILLHSAGILQRMRTHLHSYMRLEEKDKSNEEYLAVRLKHVASLFVLLCFGMIAAIAVFILECIHYTLKKYKKSKNTGKVY